MILDTLQNNNPMKPSVRFSVVVAACLLVASSLAHAAEGVWSATSGTWNTSATNWSGVSGTPWDSSNGTTNTGNFTSTSGSATVSGTVYANQITYTAASGQFAINNGTINLAGTTPTISVASRPLTISSSLDGSAGLVKSSAGTLILSGNNTYTGNTTISGGLLTIANNNALGSAANGTTISTGGFLQLQGDITVASENLDHSGGTSGYIRNLSGNNTWNGNITVSVDKSRISTLGGLLTIGGNMTLNASLIFEGGNTTVTGTISGDNAMSLGNNMADSGVVTLSGNNTYSGQTIVNRGTISVNSLKDAGVSSSLGNATGSSSVIYLGAGSGAGTLQYTGTGDTTNRQIRVGGSGGAGTEAFGAVIRNDGNGALVFSNTAFNSPVSGTTVNRTLTLGGTNTGNNTISGVIADNTAVTGRIALIKADAGTWVLTGSNTYTGATTINAGTLQIGNGGATGSLSASSAITNNASLVFNRTGTVNQGGDIGGSGTLTQNGSGTLALSGNNTYTGNTTINAGTLQISNNNALGSTAGGTTISTNGTLSLSGNITVAGEALDHSGGSGGYIRNVSGNNAWNGNITISASASRINSAAGLLTLGGNLTLNAAPIFEGAGNTTVTGTIGGSSSLQLSNNMGDNAVVTLSGNNTYAGVTYINRGILSINTIKDVGTSSSIGTGSGSSANIILLGASVGDGTLQYTGTGDSTDRRIQVGGTGGVSSEAFGAVVRNDGSGALVFSNAGFNSAQSSATANRTLTLGGTNTDANTISGVIADNNATTGRIALIKADAGTWILSGNNTYTGDTTVSAGTLIVSNTSGSATGTGNITVQGGATLGGTGIISGNVSYTSSSNSTFSGTFNGSGKTLTMNATGATLTLSGNNTYTGATVISAGKLQVGAGTDAGSIANTSAITNNGSLVYNVGSGVRTLAAPISGTGSLTQNSSGGSLALTGNNTYTGATNVTAGTLLANNTTGSATGSGTVTVASGATLGGNGIISGATTVTGIVSPGNGGIGTLHTSSLTWNGAAVTAGPDTNWIFDLGASNTSDLLAINGDFIMGTGSVFHFDFNNMQLGTYTLVTWTGNMTGFAGDGSSFSTTIAPGFSGSSFSIVGSSLVFTAVPEASTWVAMVALAISAVAMSLYRQRRKTYEFGAAPYFMG